MNNTKVVLLHIVQSVLDMNSSFSLFLLYSLCFAFLHSAVVTNVKGQNATPSALSCLWEQSVMGSSYAERRHWTMLVPYPVPWHLVPHHYQQVLLKRHPVPPLCYLVPYSRHLMPRARHIEIARYHTNARLIRCYVYCAKCHVYVTKCRTCIIQCPTMLLINLIQVKWVEVRPTVHESSWCPKMFSAPEVWLKWE